GTGINDAGLNMNGTGVLILEGNNNYVGATTVTSGVLQVGAASDVASPSSALQGSVTDNAMLAFGSSQPLTVGNLISGTGGGIDSSGSGAIVFNNGGAVVSADAPARAATTATNSAKVTLNNVYDLVVGMTVTGANIPAGTTIASINPSANSITLSSTPTIAGADTLNFGIASRTLTLTGTNT